MSPDHSARVSVTREGRRSCVIVAHDAPLCYDAVDVTGMTFAARASVVAYPAKTPDGWLIVQGDRRGPAWKGVGAPVLSADGSRLAYAATDGSVWHVVDGTVVGPPFDAILDGSITFDSSAKHLAYAVRTTDGTVVVADGVRGPAWRTVGNLTFSPGGEHIAFAATRGQRATVVVDGVAGTDYAAIGGITFSPSGRAMAYAAADSNGWYVIDRASRSGPFAYVRRLAYLDEHGEESTLFIAGISGSEAVVRGGAPEGWHNRISAVAVAASNAHWGYIADSTIIYVDGRPVAMESRTSDLAISMDGKRYAYIAADSDAMVVVDDRGRHRFDLVIDGTLQFLDTATWTCVAGERKTRELFVVVGGRRTNRLLDWVEVVRSVQGHGDAAAELRRWVAAEARLALRDSSVSP